MKKNGKIEFFRFIYCIVVILFHCQRHFLDIDKSTQHFAFFVRGYMGVEFFFLVTGFLMANTMHKRMNDTHNLGKETFRFTLSKIKAIFPYHVIAFILLFAEEIILNKYSFSKSMLKFLGYLPNLLLIQKLGFDYATLNRVEWYVSCMIFACAILYPICRKYYSMFVHVIAPVGGLMILGYITHEYGTLVPGTKTFSGITCLYLFRAIAEIALGVSAYEFSVYLSKQVFSKRQRICLTTIEAICYILPLLYCATTLKGRYDILFFLAMWVSISTSFSNQTYGNEFFCNKFIYFLGSSSMILYLNQVLGLNLAEKCFSNPTTQMIVVFAVTVVASVFSKFLVNILNT